MKQFYDKCRTKIAVWRHMGNDRNYCDDCIGRGCSCNIDPDTEIEDTDKQGRLLPCCEYDYNENGYEDEPLSSS